MEASVRPAKQSNDPDCSTEAWDRARLEIKMAAVSTEMRVKTLKGNEAAHGEWHKDTSTDQEFAHRLHDIKWDILFVYFYHDFLK